MAEKELASMSSEELQAELRKAQEALADLEEERRAFLGQTGVHIGVRILQSFRRQVERDEARIKERIASIERLLGSGGNVDPTLQKG